MCKGYVRRSTRHRAWYSRCQLAGSLTMALGQTRTQNRRNCTAWNHSWDHRDRELRGLLSWPGAPWCKVPSLGPQQEISLPCLHTSWTRALCVLGTSGSFYLTRRPFFSANLPLRCFPFPVPILLGGTPSLSPCHG